MKQEGSLHLSCCLLIFVTPHQTHPHLRHYNRLIALLMAANLVLLTYGLTGGEWWSGHGIALKAIVTVAVANFTLAIIIRQPYVINVLHWLAGRPARRDHLGYR